MLPKEFNFIAKEGVPDVVFHAVKEQDDYIITWDLGRINTAKRSVKEVEANVENGYFILVEGGEKVAV